jgi:imidazole glycerol-phosphate synthase subunit HisH
MSDLIAIIDYKVGNIQSIQNALNYLGYNSICTADHEIIYNAKAYILPGVGSFGTGIHNLEKLNLIKILKEMVLDQGKPILGICLGMQLLATRSEEKGEFKGLDFISGDVCELKSKKKFRVPHVGWNSIEPKSDHIIFSRLKPGSRFYFDHSYHFQASNEFIIAQTEYGTSITSVVQKENILGVQFHPEKSQVAGLKMLRDYFSNLRFKKDNII